MYEFVATLWIEVLVIYMATKSYSVRLSNYHDWYNTII